jgi:hypothetical protein
MLQLWNLLLSDDKRREICEIWCWGHEASRFRWSIKERQERVSAKKIQWATNEQIQLPGSYKLALWMVSLKISLTFLSISYLFSLEKILSRGHFLMEIVWIKRLEYKWSIDGTAGLFLSGLCWCLLFFFFSVWLKEFLFLGGNTLLTTLTSFTNLKKHKLDVSSDTSAAPCC